jgi:small subunit ribosomal protein S8
MSQDIIADGLNEIKNASRAKKESITVKRFSSLFLEIMKIFKQQNYIKGYRINSKDKSIEISLGEIAECRAIKPRFNVAVEDIERYLRRYLPARDFGIVIVSTNQGLMTHSEAMEKKIGGSLIAFIY